MSISPINFVDNSSIQQLSYLILVTGKHRKINIFHVRLFLDIATWEEEENMFFETHNFPAMFEKVRNQPYVIFVGVPGSGKTATARHIALKLQKEGFQILSIKDLKDIDKYWVKDKKRVFVIDDVLGIFGLDINMLDLLFRYKDTLKNLSNNDNKVIMTCREEVYRNESLCTTADDFLRKENNSVLLHSAENALNHEDKEGLLKTYKIDVDVSKIDLISTSDMFPYLCKLYLELSIDDPSFFNLPVRIISKRLDEMENQQAVQYASLVLLMANQNKISRTIMQNIWENGLDEKNSRFLDRCKVKPKPEGFEFLDALSRMIQTYTKHCNDEFSFSHDNMFEIVASHFCRKNQDLMIQYMSSDFIANNVTLNTASTLHSLSIELKTEHYQPLAERLYKDVERGKFFIVFGNVILKNPEVLDFFNEKIKNTPYEEIERVFISKLKSDLAILNIHHIHEEEERNQEEKKSYNRWYMSTPQSNLIYERHDSKCIRAIKWVVFYGHHKILQCIIDRMKAQKKSLDNLFFNSSDESNRHNSANQIKRRKKEPEPQITNEDLNKEKNRMLFLGCCSDDPTTVQILMEHVDEKVRKFQPLVIACYYGKMRLVKELIKANTDVNLINNEDDTPLIAACKGGHINVVKELVEAGANVNQAKYDCYWSHPREMDPDESKVHCKIKKRFECETPILVACENGNVELIQLLINEGADVNVSKHLAGTPLINACEVGDICVVELLLQNGANVSLIDVDGKTPLRIARVKRHFDIIKILIEKGCGNGDKTLSSACYEGDLNAVKTLIKAGADVNLKENVIAPIKAACLAGHADVVKELICEGADVNLWDGDLLPLSTACDEGHLDVVKELINARADLNLKYQSHTPLTIACYKNHIQIAMELINAGVDVNKAGRNGTPLLIASSEGHFEIARALVEAGANQNVEH